MSSLLQVVFVWVAAKRSHSGRKSRPFSLGRQHQGDDVHGPILMLKMGEYKDVQPLVNHRVP